MSGSRPKFCIFVSFLEYKVFSFYTSLCYVQKDFRASSCFFVFFFISYLCLMNIMNYRLSATFQNPNYSWTQLLAIHNKVEKKIQRFVCLPLCTTRIIRQEDASCSFSIICFVVKLNASKGKQHCFIWKRVAECDNNTPVFHFNHLFHEKGTQKYLHVMFSMNCILSCLSVTNINVLFTVASPHSLTFSAPDWIYKWIPEHVT